MSNGVKFVIGILVIFVLANAFRTLSEWRWKEEFSPDRKPDAIDHVIGRTSLDRLEEIKKKKDNFNLPAIKSAVMMFYTQHGRYPRSMAELEASGDLSPNYTHDQFGTPYDIRIVQDKLYLFGAGPDRIKGSTDDLKYPL